MKLVILPALFILLAITVVAEPTPYEFAVMSQQAYQDDGGTPPIGWEVLMISGHYGNGYYGVAYWNDQENTVIIAHRGTDDLLSYYFIPSDLLADITLSLGNIPSQFDSSQIFTQQVVARINNSETPILHTGHSLGAALAELQAAQSDSRAVTFDSPGSKKLIESLDLSPSANVTEYLAPPHLLNTVNAHIGDITMIFPPQNFDIYRRPTFFEFIRDEFSVNYWLYTRDIHTQTKLLDAFDSLTGQPVDAQPVLEWPTSQDDAYLHFLSYEQNNQFWQSYSEVIWNKYYNESITLEEYNQDLQTRLQEYSATHQEAVSQLRVEEGDTLSPILLTRLALGKFENWPVFLVTVLLILLFRPRCKLYKRE